MYCEKCGASLCEPNSSYKETRANAQTDESKRAAAKQTEPNRSSERTSHPADRSEAADNIQTAHEAVDSARAVISNLGNQVQQTAFNTKQQKIGLSFSFGFNQKNDGASHLNCHRRIISRFFFQRTDLHILFGRQLCCHGLLVVSAYLDYCNRLGLL